MIIHMAGVMKVGANYYLYEWVANNNNLCLYFRTEGRDLPETGDMVVNNWLVKKKDLLND